MNEMIRKNMTYSAISVLTAGTLFAAALPAQAVEPVPPSQVIISPDTSVSSAGLSYEQLMERLQSVEPGTDTAQTAAILFPNDALTQQQFIEVANSVDVDSGTQEGGVIQPQALPAALAPFVAAVGLCVAGAIGGAGVNELITLVHQGNQATAESRVYSAVGGCITTAVPPFLRPLAKSMQKPLATAVLWVVIKMGPRG
ncbi:hypothetical protein [Arthrobacter flavus]|uniref:Secreted protein n=1 Tax=Arthrobacter flavus TaxID=95172 RepID=A0ABW4QB30_9MICC